MGAGDTIIDGMIETAIKGVSAQPKDSTVCKAHEAIRIGMYALLLAEQDRRAGSSIMSKLGAVHAAGWGTAITGIIYIIAQMHGITLPGLAGVAP